MRKSKKLTLILLLIMLVCVVAACLCACNTPDDNSGNNQSGNNETPTHTHTLTLVNAKSADCVNSGNSAYYTCTCGKWFTDSNATTEITDKSSVIIGALGHKYSTEWSQSKTQHWHECSVCGDKKDTANHIDTDATCICGYKKPVETIKITAIYFDKSTLTLYIGNSETLNATLIPTNSTEEITWVSTNTAIATVNNGVITGVGAGTTTIIASSPSGIVANCSVFVSEDTHGFAFSEYGNGYAVTAYTGTETIVTVPDTYHNKPVIAIGTGYNGLRFSQSLIEVVLPDSISEINSEAFYSCSNLKQINIPNTVTTIGNSAFEGCAKLESIILPDNVTTIGSSAFKGCAKIESIVIPDGVAKINAYTFQECSGLKNLVIPDRVDSFGLYPFEGCVNIENLTTPSYILSQIPKGNLQTVCITSGSTIENGALKNCTQLQKIILCDTITEIGDEVFSGCSSLTSITIPNSVTSVGGGLFYNCSSLETVILSNKLESLPCYTPYHSDTIGFFEGCINLRNIELPNNIKAIDSLSFTNCSSLTDITVPESVTEIAEGAFYGCNGLESITLPFVGKSKSTALDQSIDYVFGYIFGYTYTSNDDPIEDATFQIAVTQGSSVRNYYYFIPSSLKKVSIIGNSKYINYSAFNNCKNLEEITLSDSITSIGESAFKKCSNLMSITIPSSVTAINGNAFSGCYRLVEVYNLSKLTIEAGIYNYGGVSYYAKDVYTSLDEESKLVKFDSGYTFYDGGKEIYLIGYIGAETEITLPATFKENNYKINKYAFYGCSNLTSITIPDSVTDIGECAFSLCSDLASIIIGNNVTSIGHEAFGSCRSLTSVKIGNSVTLIGDWAFWNCISLESIYYKGTQAEFNNISIDGNNQNFTSATVYEYSETEPTDDGNYWHYDTDGVTPIIWGKDE